MSKILSFLLVAVACHQNGFAQSPHSDKQNASNPIWQAAGTIDGYDTHIYSLAFGPGSILVTGDAGRVRVWDVATKQERKFYKPTAANATAITGITYSPNDTWVSLRGLNEYHLAYAKHGLKDGIPFDSGPGAREPTLTIGSDGKTYAFRSQSGKKNVVDVLRIDFDVPPMDRKRLASCHGHEDEPICAAFSPDLKLLVTGSQDKTARLWDATTGALLAVLAGHTDAVAVVEFSPNGELIASGGKDGRIKFWDVATRTERASMQGKTAVKCLSFAPKGKLLASGDEEGLLRILDVENAELEAVMMDHMGTIFAVAFNRDGNLLASGGQDKVIRLWKANPEALR